MSSRELRFRFISNFVAVIFALSSFAPYVAKAWDKDKVWFEQQLAGNNPTPGTNDPNSYLGKVAIKANQMWDSNNDNQPDPGSASLTTAGNLGARKYWQGNLNPTNITSSLLNYFDDMVTNFTQDLDGCLDAEVDIDWGWDIDINLELWWPIYQVHTHPIFQNRYGDIFQVISLVANIFGVQLYPTAMGFPQPYPLLYALDAHAYAPYVSPSGNMPVVIPPFGPNSIFQYLIQPMMMGHAKFQMEHDLFTKWGPLAGALTAVGYDTSWIFPDPVNYPIPAADPSFRYNFDNPYNLEFLSTASSGVIPSLSSKQLRYSTAAVSGRHPLEFSVLPTLFALAWPFIPVLNAMIYMLPKDCRPPPQVTYPWDSDRMEMFYYTRDPFIGKFTFTNDTNFQTDYDYWLEDPKVCTEYKMTDSSKLPNIPYDQFDSSIPLPLLPSINLPDLLTPLSPNQASNYNRMCTPKVGSNVPFTIHNTPQSVEFLAALTNIEKGARLSYAYYKQFIQNNPNFAAYYTFRMIDESSDKIQFTYHEDIPQRCYKFGDLGELFNGADAMVKKGDYGLYNATIWQYRKCDISWGQILPLMIMFSMLGPVIAALSIFG